MGDRRVVGRARVSDTESLRLAETLNRINEILRSALTPDEVLSRLVGEASKAAGFDTCLLIEVEGDRFTVTHVRNVSTDLIGRPKTREFFPAFALTASQQRPVLVGDTWSDPRTNKEFVVPHGLRAFMLLPLVVDEVTVGVVALAYAEPRVFTDDDERFAERMSLAMSLALTNSLLYESEVTAKRQARRELERSKLLQDVALAGASGIELRPLAEKVLLDVASRLGALKGDVSALNPATGRLDLLASVGYPAAIVERLQHADIDTSATLTAKVVRAARLLTHEDDDLTPERRDFLAAAGVTDHRYFVAPIVYGDKLIGTFGLSFKDTRPFSQPELDLFEGIVNVFGQAIRSARLHEAEVEAIDALREGEQRVRRKLDSILSPEGDFGELEMADVIDAPALQAMLEDFFAMTGFPVGIIDTHGTVLVGAGWQDICTRFHRVNPETCERCRESDTVLSSGVAVGEAKLYRCENGMWDIATPLVVGGEHIGNVFSGQFFFEGEEVDRQFFVEQARRYGFDEAEYMRALDAVPRFSRETVDLGMAFYMKLTHSISQLSMSTIRLARSLAERDAIAIENARLFEAEQIRARRLAAMRDIAEISASPYGVRELGRSLADAIPAFLGAGRVMILAFDASRGRLDAVGSCGYPEEIVADITQLPPEAAVARAFETGQAQVVPDAGRIAAPGFVRGNIEALGIGAFAVFPLLSGTEAIGALSIAWDEPRPFDDDERTFLGSVASAVAAGLQKAQLFELAQRRAELQRVLAEATTSLASSLDVESVLPYVLSAAADALDAQAGALLLKEPSGWRTAATCGDPAEAVVEFRPDSTTPAFQRILDTHEPVFEAGVAAQGPPRDGRAYSEGHRSFVAHPILRREQVVGVLAFSYEQARAAVSAEDDSFLARLAFAIGVAEENARLYEHERVIAHTLQEAILTPPERIEGLETSHLYRPASSSANVGGDYYDVFAIDATHVGIVIGDVSGKGIEAARLTSLLRDGLRAYALESLEPSEVLGRLNALAYRFVPTDSFSTVFFGVLDASTGVLRYCGAGHPPPVVVGSGGVTLLETTGPVLGAFPDMDFSCCCEALLESGDTLVLYTDGVTEARGTDGMFGEARLVAELGALKDTPVAQLPEALLDRVLSFCDGHLRDDTIILCVRRVGEPGDGIS